MKKMFWCLICNDWYTLGIWNCLSICQFSHMPQPNGAPEYMSNESEYIYRYKTQDKSIKMAKRFVQKILRISFSCLNIYIKVLFYLYSNFNILIKINNSNYYKFKYRNLSCVPQKGFFKRNILKVNTTLR